MLFMSALDVVSTGPQQTGHAQKRAENSLVSHTLPRLLDEVSRRKSIRQGKILFEFAD